MPRKSACPTGKRRYVDEVGAKLALTRVRDALDDRAADKLPCRAYPCKRCRGWHLTSRPLNAPTEVPTDD